MLPMAGHKGYGLALLVEILTAVLTGAAIASQVKSWVLNTPEPTFVGYAFLAIDIAQMMPLAPFKERMDGLIREINTARQGQGQGCRPNLPTRGDGVEKIRCSRD